MSGTAQTHRRRGPVPFRLYVTGATRLKREIALQAFYEQFLKGN